MVGILCIGHGIAHGAAVALAADTAAVAHAVARGSGDESNVDVDFARLNSAGTAAVAADDGGCFQLSCRNDLANAPAYAGGLDADDLALLNIVRDGIMCAAETGCRDSQVLEPQLLNGCGHDHVRHIVAVTQVMMEAEGHAVFRAALEQGFSQGRDELALQRLFIAAGSWGGFLEIFAVHVIFAPIALLAASQQLVGDIASYCVFHYTRPPS